MASEDKKSEVKKPRPVIVNMKIVSKNPVFVVGFINNREFGFKAGRGLWEYQMSLDPFKGIHEVIEGSPDFYSVSNTYMDTFLSFDIVQQILTSIFDQVTKVLQELDDIKESKTDPLLN